MKCPLLAIGILASTGRLPEYGAECLKEECAWWNEMQGQCSIKSIALHLEQIDIQTASLVEKIDTVTFHMGER